MKCAEYHTTESRLPRIPLPDAVWSAARRTLRAVCRKLAERGPRAVVLIYHAVSESSWFLSIPPKVFEAHMRYLAETAAVVDLDTIVSGKWRESDQRLTCAITFDDGFEGVYRHALPILARFNFPAAVYVTTDAIGTTYALDAAMFGAPAEKMLTWGQLREMSRCGFTVGSHLCQHLDLPLLEAPQGIEQLVRSQEIISDRLGKRCRHFAFPYGNWSRRALEWVKCTGYSTAAVVRYRPIPHNLDPYRIPRMVLFHGHDLDAFRLTVRGYLDYQFFSKELSKLIRHLQGRRW